MRELDVLINLINLNFQRLSDAEKYAAEKAISELKEKLKTEEQPKTEEQ